jgi:hypothetical protein
MNGAAHGYAQVIHSWKATMFQGDDVLFWEGDSLTICNGNDLSQYPTERLSPRHATGGSLGCLDGHVEWMNHFDFDNLAASATRNQLWCNPGRPNGH